MNKIFCMLFAFIMATQVQAQRVYDTTTTDLMDEFLRIQASTNNYSVDTFRRHSIIFLTEDISGEEVIRDSGYILCSFMGNNFTFFQSGTNVQYIQNEKYQIGFYPLDSLLIIRQPVPAEKMLLGINIMDTVFQQIAMTSISATDSNIARKLTIHFDADAPFKSYEICYRRSDYRIYYLNYSIKKEIEYEGGPIGEVRMHMGFSEYMDNHDVDHSMFSTDNYIKVISPGDIRPTIYTQNFEIVNLLVN